MVCSTFRIQGINVAIFCSEIYVLLLKYKVLNWYIRFCLVQRLYLELFHTCTLLSWKFPLIYKFYSTMCGGMKKCQFRARRALSIFKDVLLRARRALSWYKSMVIAPFCFSTKHLWIVALILIIYVSHIIGNKFHGTAEQGANYDY